MVIKHSVFDARFSRDEVKPLVLGIPGNVHESFLLRIDAERAYVLAYALGAARVLKHPDDPLRVSPQQLLFLRQS